ncbi:hypothetical protein K461DRAFT_293031 [Myriangium duriaei CBS 260.36]|uniref:SH3b domain-containing protein n=1 Tax=Myriangium duriaei CBS 260.36 TaxID=1168546 RepID=A0A9P4MP54_9PEZI|nr:hypothetical protein K461DRAFT_293031 [Myriangium duriaei CBS 260.36]
MTQEYNIRSVTDQYQMQIFNMLRLTFTLLSCLMLSASSFAADIGVTMYDGPARSTTHNVRQDRVISVPDDQLIQVLYNTGEWLGISRKDQAYTSGTVVAKQGGKVYGWMNIAKGQGKPPRDLKTVVDVIKKHGVKVEALSDQKSLSFRMDNPKAPSGKTGEKAKNGVANLKDSTQVVNDVKDKANKAAADHKDKANKPTTDHKDVANANTTRVGVKNPVDQKNAPKQGKRWTA